MHAEPPERGSRCRKSAARRPGDAPVGPLILQRPGETESPTVQRVSESQRFGASPPRPYRRSAAGQAERVGKAEGRTGRGWSWSKQRLNKRFDRSARSAAPTVSFEAVRAPGQPNRWAADLTGGQVKRSRLPRKGKASIPATAQCRRAPTGAVPLEERSGSERRKW